MNRYEVEKRLRLVFDEVLRGRSLQGVEFLDAGCGTGLFSAGAAARGAAVTSLDVGEGLLSKVAEKCDSVRVVGDVQHLPFDDQSFDIVLSTEVIEHLRSPATGVQELARVLRPGGTLVLSTPNHAWHWLVTMANVLRLRPYEGLENWASWDELRGWVRQSGVAIEQMLGFNALPFVHPVTYPLIDRLDRLGGGRLGHRMINMMIVGSKQR